MGYHKDKIEKGEIGKSSKILEEVQELIDAENQKCKVMALVELSDLVGAIIMYLEHSKSNMTIEDLITMSKITRSAFEDGTRK